MKTEQDIKNKWMELTERPIVTNDEIYEYVKWLENECLEMIKLIEQLRKA